MIKSYLLPGDFYISSPESPKTAAMRIKEIGLNHVVFRLPVDDPSAFSEAVREIRDTGVKVYGELMQFRGWAANRPILSDGNLFPKQDWYSGTNPADPDTYAAAMTTFKETVDLHPDLDGIWLDFIRWPIHWEVRDWHEGRHPVDFDSSFDAATLKQFQDATGVVIPLELDTVHEKAHWIHCYAHDEWGTWKCSIVTGFCKEAKEYLLTKGRTKLLGAFTVPWKPSDHDNAITKIVGQDYMAMAQWIDVFSPMVYNEMLGYPIPWIGDFISYCRQATGRMVLPIIMGFSIMLESHGKELTPEELLLKMTMAASAQGSDGLMLFGYPGRVSEIVQNLSVL